MSNKFSKLKFKPLIQANHLSVPITESSIIQRISILKSVFEQIESVHNEHKNLMVELDQQQQIYTKNDSTDDNYDYSFNNELLDLEFTFYRINRISTVLSMYAFLESTLNKICENKKSKLNLPISVFDLNNNGIERAKNYLDKFELVDFSGSSCNGEWSHLKILNKLRNAIAHAEGDLEHTKTLTDKQITNVKGLSLFGTTIMISDTYIVDTFRHIEKFLIYICKD